MLTHPTQQEDIYPDSDGKPMAESDFQRDYLLYAVEVLEHHFREREDVYVSGNLLIYYEEGKPHRSVAPDVFVVFGVPGHNRRVYKLWEEKVVPQFVLEITSISTKRHDLNTKKSLYARLGVQEYWLYNPKDFSTAPPSLQGFSLVSGHYRPIRRTFGGSYHSRLLGLELRLFEQKDLLFYDHQTGNFLYPYSVIADLNEKIVLEKAQAILEKDQAISEKDQAILAREQAEMREQALIHKLRALGIDPSKI